MSPGFKWLGIVFIAVLLALAMVKGAHAAERDPACVEAMTPYVGQVHDMLEAGTDPVFVRYLIRTEDGLGPAGRWLLVTFTFAWEIADDYGIHHKREEAISIAMTLCSMPPGHEDAIGSGLDGAVTPLRNERI